MTRHLVLLALVPALALSACATTTRTTTTWGEPYGAYGDGQEWVRYGHVESIQETVERREGNPAAGAVAGAVVGGVLGSVLGGHTAYDAWGRAYRVHSGVGAMVGAVGGAAIGAAASQGASEARTYDVFVRYDDGGGEVYAYQGASPFRVGEAVALTAQGLAPR